ncbi:MAG: YIP1 family protein [SAR202 cluster bacterium]|nr:YIP1 family protein [SAR202 cluster bacterium]
MDFRLLDRPSRRGLQSGGTALKGLSMKGMFARGIRAAKFDRTVYAEVAARPDLVLNSLGIVILAGFATIFGYLNIWYAGRDVPPLLDDLGGRALGLWLAVLTMLVGWIIWAGIAVLMGKIFMHGGGSFRDVLRVLGICYLPGVLFMFSSIPGVGNFIGLAAQLWILFAGAIAMHEVQKSDWIGAALGTLVGWFVGVVIVPYVVIDTFVSVAP